MKYIRSRAYVEKLNVEKFKNILNRCQKGFKGIAKKAIPFVAILMLLLSGFGNISNPNIGQFEGKTIERIKYLNPNEMENIDDLDKDGIVDGAKFTIPESGNDVTEGAKFYISDPNAKLPDLEDDAKQGAKFFIISPDYDTKIFN